MARITEILRPVVGFLVMGVISLSAAEQRALLVGVSRYPALADRYQLSGPANDVIMMRKLLIDKFRFKDGDAICILSEDQGKESASKLPTRENIEREFSKLISAARTGDDIVIFLAGHGAQEPSDDDSESDG